jgi:hypothetical protein
LTLYTGFEVLTDVVMGSSIFWDIKPCSPLKFKYVLLAIYFHAGFLLGLSFDPEDEGYVFLQNVFEFQVTIRRYIPEEGTLHTV